VSDWNPGGTVPPPRNPHGHVIPSLYGTQHRPPKQRERKHRLKRFVVRWELTFYAVTGLLYLAALVATYFLFPQVGNLALQLTILATGFTSTAAAAASAIKSAG
jgi:hypothetical protein